jgi:hypothetical protein
MFVGLDLQPWQLAIVDRLAAAEAQLAQLQTPSAP